MVARLAASLCISSRLRQTMSAGRRASGAKVDFAPRLYENEGTNEGGSSSMSAHELVGRSRTQRTIEESSRFELDDRLVPAQPGWTTQTRLMRKRRCRRSIAGIRLVTSAVFPGHISVHTGRPSPSSSTARIIWLRSGRWSLEKPRRPASGRRTFEIEAGRVHEHDVERGQKVAPAGEQLLLQDVLHAARRKRRRGVLLVFGQLLASTPRAKR